MTVEIKGDNIKITFTKEELKGLRPSLPYELTSLIGEAESDHDGYASRQKPAVQSSQSSVNDPLHLRKNYRFTNPTIDSIVRNQLEKGHPIVTVTGPQNVMEVL